jgi:hypothetical protein
VLFIGKIAENYEQEVDVSENKRDGKGSRFLASLKHLATVGYPEVAACHLTDQLKQHGFQYFRLNEPGAKLEIEIYEWKPRHGGSRREMRWANECRARVPMNKHHVRTSVKEDPVNDMHEPAVSGTTYEDFDESKACLPDSGREKLGKCDVITSILFAKDAKPQVPEFITLSSIFSSREGIHGRNGVFKVEAVLRSSNECYKYGHLVIADNGATAINKTATRSNMNPGRVTGSSSCEPVAAVIDPILSASDLSSAEDLCLDLVCTVYLVPGNPTQSLQRDQLCVITSLESPRPNFGSLTVLKASFFFGPCLDL